MTRVAFRVGVVLGILLLLIALDVSSAAASTSLGGKLRYGDTIIVPATETVNSDLYIFAGSVTMDGAVHGDLVVPTKTGFAKATLDRGFVQSVSGTQLTLREGTKTSTYKTVTLTIPAGARVRDNRQAATLSDLKPGQRALVLQGPKRTLVVAHDVRTH